MSSCPSFSSANRLAARRAAAAFSDPVCLESQELGGISRHGLLWGWKDAAGKAVLCFTFQPPRQCRIVLKLPFLELTGLKEQGYPAVPARMNSNAW